MVKIGKKGEKQGERKKKKDLMRTSKAKRNEKRN